MNTESFTMASTHEAEENSDMEEAFAEKEKQLLVNNLKLVYDQNSDRSRKRQQQMKRMKTSLTRVGEDEGNFLTHNFGYKTGNKHELILLEDNHTENAPQDGYDYAEENNINNDYDITIEGIENENAAEVVVSDLDCSLGDNQENENPSTKSFVPLANNLKMKKSQKEDNATSSYLLALAEEDIHSRMQLEEDKKFKKIEPTQNIRHLRLPSGKNFIITSVIEEEKSGTYSDSEILSSRKKSYLLSTRRKIDTNANVNVNACAISKSNSSIKVQESKEFHTAVEKNLDVILFNQIALNSHMHSHTQSTVEAPGLSGENKMREKNKIISYHKSAKSELFNIQLNLKRTLDEMTKKKTEEDERGKYINKLNKKTLINTFYSQVQGKENQIAEEKTKIKLFTCGRDHTTGSGKAREEFYKVTPEKAYKSTREEFEMKLESPIIEKSSLAVQRNESYCNQIREQYKQERRKKNSSIFKSEDLRISNAEKIDLKNSFVKTNEQMMSNYNSNCNYNTNLCERVEFVENLNLSSEKKPNSSNRFSNVISPEKSNETKQKMFEKKRCDLLKVSNEIHLDVIPTTQKKICALNKNRNISMELLAKKQVSITQSLSKNIISNHSKTLSLRYDMKTNKAREKDKDIPPRPKNNFPKPAFYSHSNFKSLYEIHQSGKGKIEKEKEMKQTISSMIHQIKNINTITHQNNIVDAFLDRTDSANSLAFKLRNHSNPNKEKSNNQSNFSCLFNRVNTPCGPKAKGNISTMDNPINKHITVGYGTKNEKRVIVPANKQGTVSNDQNSAKIQSKPVMHKEIMVHVGSSSMVMKRK